MLGLMALAAVWGAGRAAALSSTDDGTITVTPVAALLIDVGGNVALGNVDVGASTYSTTGQYLKNFSYVGVKVKSKIGAPSGWTASTSAGFDTYVLKNLAADAVPDPASIAAQTALSGSDLALSGAQTMGATGQSGDTTNIWYGLSMPTSVSNTSARTITITYTAEAL